VETFQEDIANNRFAEWALVHGNYYGTSRKAIDQTFAAKKSVLLDIDVQGAESLRRAYPEEAFTVFISPPDLQTLERRLRARGTDKEEVIAKRVHNAREEMQQAARFHAVVINDDLERAYAELKAAVRRVLQGATS
jgi:guanylate kinase